jgi:hypothetical protein
MHAGPSVAWATSNILRSCELATSTTADTTHDSNVKTAPSDSAEEEGGGAEGVADSK